MHLIPSNHVPRGTDRPKSVDTIGMKRGVSDECRVVQSAPLESVAKLRSIC